MSIEFSKDQVINALPAQSGNSGKYLTTDGTDASWQNASGSAVGYTPFGADPTGIADSTSAIQ